MVVVLYFLQTSDIYIYRSCKDSATTDNEKFNEKKWKLVFGTCYLEMCFDPCQRVIIRDLLPSSSSTMGEGMANPTQVLSPPLWRQEVSPKKGLSNPHGDQQPQLPEGTKDLGHSPSPLPTMRLKRETNHLKMNLWTSRGIENHLWTTYSTIQTQKRKKKKDLLPSKLTNCY